MVGTDAFSGQSLDIDALNGLMSRSDEITEFPTNLIDKHRGCERIETSSLVGAKLSFVSLLN